MRIDLDTVKDLYYNQNLTKKQVAERIGSTEGSIEGFMARHGLQGRTIKEVHNSWKTPEAIQSIRNMYSDGMTKIAIAKKFGFKSVTPINFIFDQFEIKSEGNTGRRTKCTLSKEELSILYKTKTAVEIAHDLECSPALIDQRLESYNIETNIKFGKSLPCKKICDWLDSINVSYETNNRKVIKPQEIDIYLPQFNLGIEVNGVYWHGESKVGKSYHVQKSDKAEEAGIQLLHFWDLEVIEQFKKVQDMIMSKIGKNVRVYARKCTLKNISSEEANQFFNKYHLQGSCNTRVNISLIHKSKIVAVAGFSSPRYATQYELELVRFCSLEGMSVIGGFSKIMKSLSQTVISYANRRWSVGKVYEVNGWVKTHTTAPGYYYYINNKGLQHRSAYQKHKLKTLDNYDDAKSEYQIMLENGHDRVWDCGHIAYEWNMPVKEMS